MALVSMLLVGVLVVTTSLAAARAGLALTLAVAGHGAARSNPKAARKP
jgi:hypothetical protein